MKIEKNEKSLFILDIIFRLFRKSYNSMIISISLYHLVHFGFLCFFSLLSFSFISSFITSSSYKLILDSLRCDRGTDMKWRIDMMPGISLTWFPLV